METAIVKNPVGRPRLADTTIKELKDRIASLEGELGNKNNEYNELKELAEIVRIVQRAAKGLGADDDIFAGLIDVKDIRERTRLDEAALLSHSAMKIASTQWPEFAIYEKIRSEEDHYYISEDGEGRKEGILQQQAKSKLDANLVLNMPNTQGGPAQDGGSEGGPPPKKGGLFSKIPFLGKR